MPTVLRLGAYRFYSCSREPNEPPHIRVDRDSQSAKFWLKPVALAGNIGFNARELRRLQSVVVEHQTQFLEAWYGRFDPRANERVKAVQFSEDAFSRQVNNVRLRV